MNLRTSDTLKVTTTSTSACDVFVSYRDRGPGVPVDGSGNSATAITTATTTTILSPLGGTAFATRDVESISIRNKGAASNTVTVSLVSSGGSGGTAGTYELYSVALAAGSVLVYEKGAAWFVVTASTLGQPQTVILASDVTNANASANTIADVTGLSFAVVASATYQFSARIPYTSAATTTGSRWAINGPSLTSLYVSTWTPLTASTQNFTSASAYDTPASASTDSLAAGNVAVMEGFITCSAAGTVIVRFASEVSASAIVAKAGATLTYVRVA